MKYFLRVFVDIKKELNINSPVCSKCHLSALKTVDPSKKSLVKDTSVASSLLDENMKMIVSKLNQDSFVVCDPGELKSIIHKVSGIVQTKRKLMMVGHSFFQRFKDNITELCYSEERCETEILRVDELITEVIWETKSGAHLSKVSKMLSAVKEANPNIVIIEVGSNDLTQKHPPPLQLAGKVIKMAKAWKNEVPGLEEIVHGTKVAAPCNGTVNAPECSKYIDELLVDQQCYELNKFTVQKPNPRYRDSCDIS